jgi:hypothetical protein
LSAGSRPASREVIDAAQAIADERGLGLMQVHVLGGMSAVSRCFLADQMESLLGLLVEFGAVTAGRSLRSRRSESGPWNAWKLTCPARSIQA